MLTAGVNRLLTQARDEVTAMSKKKDKKKKKKKKGKKK